MRPHTDDLTPIVRAGAFAALLAFTNAASTSIVVAQSGPPPLTPLRGLIDHVSVNITGPATSSMSKPDHTPSAPTAATW